MINFVDIDIPLNIDPGGTMPEVTADEHTLTVSFYLVDSKNRGVIKFDSFLQFTFGYPNEEALSGHRYAALGLSAFRFVEVINSEVIKSIIDANRVHPYHKDQDFDDYRHFVLPFHDTTLEVVAKSYDVSI